jgi:hypothetical protein
MSKQLPRKACYRYFATSELIAAEFRKQRPDDGEELLQKLRNGEAVPKDAENCFGDIVLDALQNDAENVETYYAPGGESGPFPIWIQTLAGVYWVRPLEGGSLGYFLSSEEAEAAAFDNWDSLTTDQDEDYLWE